MNLKKSIISALVAAAFVFGLAAPAAASRANGVCGGVGTYNLITGECE